MREKSSKAILFLFPYVASGRLEIKRYHYLQSLRIWENSKNKHLHLFPCCLLPIKKKSLLLKYWSSDIMYVWFWIYGKTEFGGTWLCISVFMCMGIEGKRKTQITEYLPCACVRTLRMTGGVSGLLPSSRPHGACCPLILLYSTKKIIGIHGVVNVRVT